MRLGLFLLVAFHWMAHSAFCLEKSDVEWAQKLTAEQMRICRHHGDEAAFSGKYEKTKETGIYRCVGCGEPLFDSSTKYESGTGYPSFSDVIRKDAIDTHATRHLAITRTEVLCHQCGAHLGYLFDDGPAPTFKRYRINSACLEFYPAKK